MLLPSSNCFFSCLSRHSFPRYTSSMNSSRRPSSETRSNAKRFPPSPLSTYSEATSRTYQRARNLIVEAFAGAFIRCLTPTENETSKDFSPSNKFRSPSVGSNASIALRNGSVKGRGAFSTTYNSTQERETGNVKFTLEEIYAATKNFSPSFKIGQGGFGIVYKGKLDDGTIVAVKRAKKSLYDKLLGLEFQREVQTLSQVEHLNLVKFYGYMEYEDERIIVVEYVDNGTLREHLDCMHGKILDFASRLDIAIDVAHAVTYLHMYTDHPIIHRDIKSSNILLTGNFRAKVADFGFARHAADSESGNTHVSTQVKGTAGYLDPEYLRTYQLTEKSDVYSFGVLLVELVTGRRAIEPKRELKERITATWAMKKFIDGDGMTVLDPKLDRVSCNNLALEKILELALQCLASHRRRRPSMSKCAEILWVIRKDYKEISLTNND